MTTLAPVETPFVHEHLACGAELAIDPLPERHTVAIYLRMLSGVTDEPDDYNGVTALTERLLPQGTQHHTGQQLADAFDRLGAKWGHNTGRQSTLIRALCLPEFVPGVLDLFAELLTAPTFPEDACRVAREHAEQDLRTLDDEPDDLIRQVQQRLVYGPRFGRWTGGTLESLARINRDVIRDYWSSRYAVGRMQIAIAGPVDADDMARQIDRLFTGFGDATRAGREDADFTFTPQREHRHKELEQQHIAIALPGAVRGTPDFPIEQVLLGVLSGGMSGRLFTEVREKQGLVYWVGAWHEQPRGRGVIQLGASTTPARSDKTFKTLQRELARLSEDLTDAEVTRARDALVAQAQTEDDLTRARAGSLSDDLFHHGRPIGLAPKLAAVEAVTTRAVRDYARRLRRDQLCVATLGPRALP